MNTEEQIDNQDTKDLKLYSQRAISIATFLASPLAAGYFIRENYRALGKNEAGHKAFLIGLVSTILLFGGILLIPEEVLEKIPNQLFPIIYTAITFAIVEKTQGEVLKQHKANGYEFYSAWRAAGIAALLLLAICIPVVIFIFIFAE
ncbi:MAG: hypothetical protein CMO01_30655 [Thalassobius sp.]|nr:hypothetical protein [Thalassovita sp.]|tara:strand:+ start:192 stop:632 length:441 start_codon:yes stop_codon:yes gene_type:complete